MTDDELLLNEAEEAHKSKHYQVAYEICTKLAAKGNAEAQYHVAVYFEYGFFAEKNRKVAYSYFKQSAENGFTPSADKVKLIELNFEAYMKS